MVELVPGLLLLHGGGLNCILQSNGAHGVIGAEISAVQRQLFNSAHAVLVSCLQQLAAAGECSFLPNHCLVG